MSSIFSLSLPIFLSLWHTHTHTPSTPFLPSLSHTLSLSLFHRGLVLEMAGHPNEYNTNTFRQYDMMTNPTGIVMYSSGLHCFVLYCVALYLTVLHCITPYCTVLYCIAGIGWHQYCYKLTPTPNSLSSAFPQSCLPPMQLLSCNLWMILRSRV